MKYILNKIIIDNKQYRITHNEKKVVVTVEFGV